MRPRRKILLLCGTDEELSYWRLRLELRGYHALCALTFADAVQVLAKHEECRTVLTTVSQPVGRLVGLPEMKVLLAGDSMGPTDSFTAHGWEPQGPALVERTMNRLRILDARKRGPRRVKFSQVLETVSAETAPYRQAAALESEAA